MKSEVVRSLKSLYQERKTFSGPPRLQYRVRFLKICRFIWELYDSASWNTTYLMKYVTILNAIPRISHDNKNSEFICKSDWRFSSWLENVVEVGRDLDKDLKTLKFIITLSIIDLGSKLRIKALLGV